MNKYMTYGNVLATATNNTAQNPVQFDISSIEVINGYVNLTRLAKSQGKEIKRWLALPTAKKYIEALQAADAESVIRIARGDNSTIEQGTFGNRNIALKIAQWISVDFEVWCIRQIDTLLQTGKVELPTRTASYQIQDDIERAKAWIVEQEEKRLLVVENKAKDNSIIALAKDVQATRETLAKNYKTVDARNKADLGNAINLIVNKHFKNDGDNFADAHKTAWHAYYEVTGVKYYGATVATYEQKMSFLTFLTSL